MFLTMVVVGQGSASNNHNYKYIYTDGSKVDEKVAAAAVTDSEIFMNRLADHSSIFTAEAKAISLALGTYVCGGLCFLLVTGNARWSR